MSTQIIDNISTDLESIIHRIRDPKNNGYILGTKVTDEMLSVIIDLAAEEQWEQMHFHNAGITKIPREISKIKSLKNLSFQSYHFFEEEFYNTIKVIPEELFDLENLEGLNLLGCPIINLPSRISKLKKLSSLNLSETKIEILPEELFGLKNLEKLYISGCPIEELSPEIHRLKKLSLLFLHGTKISYIPSEVFQLNLKELSLAANVTNMLDGIEKLKKLSTLILLESELIELPSCIGELTELEEIYLHGSKVKHFPSSMKNLVNLKRLILEDTPFEEFIPPEILKQPATDIVNYILRYQEDPDKIKLNESKMIIVGQGGVGKSSLLQRLIHHSYSEPGTLDSTEGIDVEQWSINIEDEDYKLNVWDFGGQEIYHSTHQFFLTNRSLYVLVWDARQEDEYGRIDYWLNTVESFAGDSPIILVINKCDERKNVKYVDLKSLQNNFEQIVDVYEVSCRHGNGIYELEHSIKTETVKLPLINIVWLSSWIKIRKHLEELASSKDVISFTEYQDICQQYNVKEGEAKSLSQYMHDLGIILHFQEDVLLKDFVILSPDWGTDAVYKVLDAEDDLLQNRNGTLFIEDLPEIWTDRVAYPEDKYALILRLMENFQLSFELNRNKAFLIPELMENEEIELDGVNFNDSESLTFQYEYEFLPAGIMTRFIVKAHNYLLDKNEHNKVCWKKGAYLQYKDSLGKARLFDNVSNKRIEIQIVGPNKRQNRELLQRIRSNFDEIHNSINKLKLKEKIQCNCNSFCEHKYDYKTLLRLEEHGHEDTVCEKSMVKVTVTALLDGIGSLEDRQKNRELYMEKFNNIIVNNTINTENHNDNKSNSESRNKAENKNHNRNNNITTISIEVRAMIDGLAGDLQDMKDEVTAVHAELIIDFEKLEHGLNKLNDAETKEEIIRSGVLKKFDRFMQEVQDEESLLGKTIKNIKYGFSIAQDIADKYNTIAEWCGIPVVPRLFLKK